MKRSILLILLFPLLATAQKIDLTVLFAFDKAELTDAAKITLDSIIATTRTEKIPLQLYGHCDGKGSDAYNDALSTRRVNAVKNYLL